MTPNSYRLLLAGGGGGGYTGGAGGYYGGGGGGGSINRGTFIGAVAGANAGAGKVVFIPVCFATGTRVHVWHDGAAADVAIESLRLGDLVVTASDELRPIRWLRHRTVACGSDPKVMRPIRIAAHALGENRPSRDLFVSPGHSICVDAAGEVLIPAGLLVNGTTIVQIEVETVTYWHVELDTHEIILAENLPAESYLEMGNRSFFAEADVVALAASPDAPVRTHADFCRPFVSGGPVLGAVRARLGHRATLMATEAVRDQHIAAAA